MTTQTKTPAVQKPQVPMTMGDRIGICIFASLFIGLAAWMFFRPDVFTIDPAEVGRRARGWMYIIDMAWSRPVAVVIALIGLAIAWGGLTDKTKTDPNYKEPEKAPESPTT